MRRHRFLAAKAFSSASRSSWSPAWLSPRRASSLTSPLDPDQLVPVTCTAKPWVMHGAKTFSDMALCKVQHVSLHTPASSCCLQSEYQSAMQQQWHYGCQQFCVPAPPRRPGPLLVAVTCRPSINNAQSRVGQCSDLVLVQDCHASALKSR